jgi:hypothetical protein
LGSGAPRSRRELPVAGRRIYHTTRGFCLCSFVIRAFWLAGAVVVDYVCFVRIKNPISLNPHNFYIGQFPWIYLIYVTVLFAPLCSVILMRCPSKD